MSPLPKWVDISFERECFFRELADEYQTIAYEFCAFTQSRKIRIPPELLQVVMLYCGMDLSLRGAAGHLTLLSERMTDTVIRRRLKVYGLWLKAMIHHLCGERRTASLNSG